MLSESVEDSFVNTRYTRVFYISYSSLNISYLRNITFQNSFLLYCFLEKRLKKGQNTVFGYKKGSKFDLEIGSKSATPKLCMNIFTTFFPKCSQHRKPEGNPQNPPPAVFEVTI